MRAKPLASDRATELIFDWNEVSRRDVIAPRSFALVDETLREGLQNPSVSDPTIDQKIGILHLMEELGIEWASIGLPSSSRRAFDDALRLCQELQKSKLKIQVSAAGRTVPADITPIIEISQRTGLRLEVCAFIGSSPIRQYVEQWDVDLIAKRSAEAIDVAVKAGLPVCYITEDTTRSRPEVLSTLFRAAIDHGASRLCLSDTAGHATPDGVRSLVQFARDLVAEAGASTGIDWHGHNDRGLALVNALHALAVGADRVHGTALGLGERVGNAPIELILLNLRLQGELAEGRNLSKLVVYCEAVARAVRWTIPSNYPLVGRDAFRTATGVHAAAIAKALQKGDRELADSVYSGVPAELFGRRQEIDIGFMSGSSNVAFWLRQRSIEPSDDLIAAILQVAKATTQTLRDDEVLAVVHRVRR
jgi:isopropylmalate/homocitrate/citramalate synthase